MSLPAQKFGDLPQAGTHVCKVLRVRKHDRSRFGERVGNLGVFPTGSQFALARDHVMDEELADLETRISALRALHLGERKNGTAVTADGETEHQAFGLAHRASATPLAQGNVVAAKGPVK